MATKLNKSFKSVFKTKLILLVDKSHHDLITSVQEKYDCMIVKKQADIRALCAQIKTIKADFRTACLPLILLCKHHEAADIAFLQTIIAAGIDDYVVVPYTTDGLIARIDLNIARNTRDLDTNPLTRLPGNRAIARVLEQRDYDATLIYIDNKNFKQYNDRYGFLAGDVIIQRTAKLLASVLETDGMTNDFLGHIGGDDFVVITQQNRAVCLSQVIQKRCAKEIGEVQYSIIILKQSISPLASKSYKNLV